MKFSPISNLDGEVKQEIGLPKVNWCIHVYEEVNAVVLCHIHWDTLVLSGLCELEDENMVGWF